MATGSDSSGAAGGATAHSTALAVDTRLAVAEVAVNRAFQESRAAESITQQIANLKQEQAANRAARAKVQKDLKNAQRRKRRLKSRVRQLTNEDLLAVLVMRNEASGAAGASSSTAAGQACTGGAAEPSED